MEIISHRGFWVEPSEKNKIEAFERSFSIGFGTETDIRDRDEELVIAHDVANRSDITFEEFCGTYKKYSCEKSLALNIKSDGLALKLKQVLLKYKIENYFLFDMSAPNLRASISVGLKCFTRISDAESYPIFYESCAGVWMDGFYSDWYTYDDIYKPINDGKKVCLVSSELHNRDNKTLWEFLKSTGLHCESQLILCTDHPDDASSFFQGEIA